jgi:hypothetical protein
VSNRDSGVVSGEFAGGDHLGTDYQEWIQEMKNAVDIAILAALGYLLAYVLGIQHHPRSLGHAHKGKVLRTYYKCVVPHCNRVESTKTTYRGYLWVGGTEGEDGKFHRRRQSETRGTY